MTKIIVWVKRVWPFVVKAWPVVKKVWPKVKAFVNSRRDVVDEPSNKDHYNNVPLRNDWNK